MANDSVTIDRAAINKKRHSSQVFPAFITHLEEARNWCECLARYDLDAVEISPAVLRKQTLALAESIEAAYQAGLEFTAHESVIPFTKG